LFGDLVQGSIALLLNQDDALLERSDPGILSSDFFLMVFIDIFNGVPPFISDIYSLCVSLGQLDFKFVYAAFFSMKHALVLCIHLQILGSVLEGINLCLKVLDAVL
jgi:hypothetical protein